MLPDPALLGSTFHNLFKISSNNIDKSDSDLKKRKRWSSQKIKQGKADRDGNFGPPEIELLSNASEFAVFSSVRRSVLEAWANKAAQIYLATTGDIEHDSDDDVTEIWHPPPPRLPKVVGVGLRCVVDIIRESRNCHIAICIKALGALLDILQGQQPENLTGEPADVIDPLFDLLLELATTNPEGASQTDAAQLTATACSCLLSLVVVRGSTCKLLAAAAALLMCPRSQTIHLPLVLTSLQRSVQAVLLGKITRPDWLTHGVPNNSLVELFPVANAENLGEVRSLAADGQYIYLYTARGLFKVGSGLGGTVRGRIYHNVPDFFHDERGWLGYAGGWLWLKVAGKKGCELLRIDREPFRVLETVRLDARDWGSGVWFSDGELLGIVAPLRDDGFVVRTINPIVKPLAITAELTLKLARKCVDVIGSWPQDEESGTRPLNTGCDDEIASICVGKEFNLVRTTNGKVLYSGKPSSLGLKISGSTSKWNELPIPKSPRISHVAVGHEGGHAVLVADDGAAYFVGTPKRGEDGDQSKARRQPKPVKPKRMALAKLEWDCIVNAAANNGTTALVTRDGQLLMFGKDTVHCNSTTGQVSDLKGQQVTQVALGKAHAVALTSKGTVFTFGINNKGQCGRDLANMANIANLANLAIAPKSSPQSQVVTAMETAAVEENAERDEDAEWEDGQDIMCARGKHQWRHDLCMVCSVCLECTGYSISCLSSIRPDRNPGQECGCGEGDSGCAVCGCCRVCAREQFDNSELAILGPSGANDLAGLYRLDFIFGAEGPAQGMIAGYGRGRLHDQLQRRLDERRQPRRLGISSAGVLQPIRNISRKIGVVAGSSKAPQPASPQPSNIIFRAPPPVKFSTLVANEEAAGGSDLERDASRVTSLPPAPVPLQQPVVQISCGLHHTALLTQPGEVFTFGSNVYGQLGVGDVVVRGGPARVPLPSAAIAVVCGSNHTVVLTTKGEVFTFGSYQKGQLGRKSGGEGTSRREGPWYSFPGPIPGIGPRAGRRATWVGAAGDQTFIKLDESLINSASLEKAALSGSKSCILLIPNSEGVSFHSLAISRRDGSCVSFSNPSQARLSGHAICIDPLYNVLWSFDGETIRCDQVMKSEARRVPSPSLLEPGLCLPTVAGCAVRRSQAALYLLAALDTLAQAHTLHMDVARDLTDVSVRPVTKVYSVQDFSTVNRFENHGGGWGYSAHSIEAIRFMADADVLLGGFGLFGGRGEYTAKIRLLDVGIDGGEQESDGEVIAETDDVQYECGARQKYPIMFEEPVTLQAHRWYVAWARISGPSSDCGANGKISVVTDDNITFSFKTSKKSNNGTDVNAGQVPQVLYRMVAPESKPSPRPADQGEPVYVLSKDFSTAVTRECFNSLIALLQWSWANLKAGYMETSATGGGCGAQSDNDRLSKLVYISRACLRLLHFYINEIQPNQRRLKTNNACDVVRLTESLSDVRAMLRQMLSDRAVTGPHKPLTDAVLEETHRTFVTVYHALYPTPYLKWTCLCQLLSKTDKSGSHFTSHDTLLAAVLAALCGPSVRLRATLPLLSDPRTLSPSDASPLLGEATRDVDGGGWAWREVLERLLDLVTLPVKRALAGRPPLASNELVNHGCHLLARIVAELASQSSGTDEDVESSCGRVLHTTPSRFLRTNLTRTWNTGNGSADAVCFSVDRPGVVIAGACVYGGLGVYEYQLELLDDQSGTGGDPSPAQRWISLEVAKGSFGPDDFMSDVAEIKFSRPVLIKENVKYALRLRNQGSRTSNGDGGLSSIKGPDGTNFTFSTCSLSLNGTTQTRGQIPQILYYSNPGDNESQVSTRAVVELQARRSTLSITSAILNRVCLLMSSARDLAEDLDVCQILAGASVVTTLLPLVLAHIGPLATSDPRSAVHVLHLVQELLPHVAALNLLDGNRAVDTPKVTTSNHYAWVESDHPYKPASVSNYRVAFPESVKWLAVEFNPDCGAAQNEDSLQLYIRARRSDPDPSEAPDRSSSKADSATTENSTAVPYWPVLRRLRGGMPWPQGNLILPGNEVIFSLETASDYLKDEKANSYGFRCLVVGYEWNLPAGSGLKHLESELVYLAGMCAASLIKKDLQLPTSMEEAEEEVEEAALWVVLDHPELLTHGIALAQPPSVTQALDGVLPLSFHSNERLFLRDLLQCSPGTSGGRLARWLQPESYADPGKCEVSFSRDDLRCGWPATLSVLTRDQYGDLVHVPALKVDVKAMPIDKKEVAGYDRGRKVQRVSEAETPTFGPGPPPIETPYEVTVKDKVCYIAINMMPAYESYSFEELRFYSPTVKRTSETMLVRPNGDGSYSVTWTPSTVGWYSILVTIDDYVLEEVYKVEVKDPPQGVAPPSQNIVQKATHQPNRVRKFVAKDSAGLRVRAHPSLQSEQIGVVHVNGIIAFIDEVHNDDGVWLRLNHDTMRQYCPNAMTGIGEAWCLQYNQHFGKTLLLPVEEPRTILEQVIKETTVRPSAHSSAEGGLPGFYTVVKCGASGHNVRSMPSMAAPRVGMMVLGNKVQVVDHVTNAEGTWIRLSPELTTKFCFNHEGEAWCLALSPNDVLYLRHDLTQDGSGRIIEEEGTSVTSSPKRAFDFSSSPGATAAPVTGQTEGSFSFSSTPPLVSSAHEKSANPFVFGSSSRDLKAAAVDRFASLHKWFKGEDGKGREKGDGLSRVNGNGDTPPDTPPRRLSRSSSPRGGIVRGRTSRSASPQGEKTSHSSSPLPIPGAQPDSAASASQRRGSTQSDTSALVSSLTRDLSQSPLTKDSTPSPPSSSLHMLSDSPPRHAQDPSGKGDEKDSLSNSGSGRAVMQTGTQTSPESGPTTAMKGCFSIGTSGSKDERGSPKLQRKDRSTRSSKRPMSPVATPLSSTSLHHTGSSTRARQPVKEAMSPSEAESLRATFAAFLWQEGIVHDAMACASFLKFHPNLPKEGATVVTRRATSPRPDAEDQRHMQRHSVEVTTSGNYLHIKPATLESLTRSAANANANRTRRKVISGGEASIKEEGGSHTVSVLPPALRGLVLIWQHLTAVCRHAAEMPALVASPSLPNRSTKPNSSCKEKTFRSDCKKLSRKKKELKPAWYNGLAVSVIGPNGERETVCELCGGIFPHPVTYHMRQSHPGCGSPAGGKGYNSSGNYCMGWAGHCGDGGVGGSSWYLVCDTCRDRYLKAKREGVKERGRKPSSKKKIATVSASVVPVAAVAVPSVAAAAAAAKLLSPGAGLTQSLMQDAHIAMRDNAMFLLELTSASHSVQHGEQKAAMPSVSEAISPTGFTSVGPFLSLPFLCPHLPQQQLDHLMQPQQSVQPEEAFNGNPSQSRPLSAIELESEQKGRPFHRSASMGNSGAPWARQDGDGRVVMARRRNNSTSEVTPEGGSSLLCHPSANLQKLVPGLEQSAIIGTEERPPLDLISRPCMAFMLRRHPLNAFRLAMKHAVRKATCRVFAFQALNWLLHNATQPGCLHDLLWWFHASFFPASDSTNANANANNNAGSSADPDSRAACEHPLADITFAGDAAVPLWQAFHQLLQTVSDLMLLLPPGSPLQTMAVRCWSIRFTQADHVFLHRSHVFSNISKILSRSEEEDEDTHHLSPNHHPECAVVESLKDITAAVELKVSSRQAMISSLTDSSTETFWESGEEDRNKTKSITITCPPGNLPRILYVHIDNARDLANKVSMMTFLSGCSGEELTRVKQIDIESRASGWISCPILNERHSVLRLELKGSDNSLRVRQIRVLGETGESLGVNPVPVHSATIHKKLCEAETLKVFRLITARVFGKLISGEAEVEPEAEVDSEPEAVEGGAESGEHSDLKEHVVGILFSRCKLSHLQKQVCMHIVHAIRKEATRVRDEWETLLCSPVPLEGRSSDAYAFEMLSMVLALSGSSGGRVYLSYQFGLLTDLFSLLHTGSARVQRQVIALLRRVLPEVPPATLAKVLGVDKLPPTDFSISALGKHDPRFDPMRVGILDVFLSVVAKSLTVQVKVKGKESKGVTSVTLATAIHPRDQVGQRWWLRGCISRRLAEHMILLLNDMSAGKLSEAWANITKGAIAENIMNVTRLEEEQRGPQECLRTPTLWLALASLCVLDQQHVDRLSSGQWAAADGQPPQPRQLCRNHDDGETGAIIQCSVCGNLCAECDRVLHLPRHMRAHQRQVCKEEEEAIKVDLHEGCGRTKLFWLLALADSSTLKALVEFREGSRSKTSLGAAAGVCRFCGATAIPQGLLAIGNVCADPDCQQHARNACNKVHLCGHQCGGISAEVSCLPCLQGCRPDAGLKQDADDMCMICFTEALSCAPALLLACGHVFHAHCARLVLTRRWAGPRISFSFAQCPICKANIDHLILKPLLAPIRELWEDVRRKALMRLEYEGLHRVEAITGPGARFYNDPAAYAMDRYAYYVCYKCNKAYYGGEARCDVEMVGDYDPRELVCGACSDVARAQMCPKHGADFLEYKCRYCCSVAVFFCFGSTHFCSACHDDFQRVTNIPRNELPSCPAGPRAKQLEGEDCPLNVTHPATGEEFALGCGVCRNAHTF